MITHVLDGVPKVLVLAPHTDDAELGCGGTIARLLQSGANVFVAAFSTAEDSLPPGAPVTQLRDEFLEAMRILGVPDREVLEDLVKLRRRINPDTMLLPSSSDLHQDHQVLCAEGLRLSKDLTVWGYELPWNHITFSAQAFVTLERCHLERKWAALQAYRSQLQLGRPYFCRSFVEGLVRVRSVQVHSEFAEAFEVIRIKW